MRTVAETAGISETLLYRYFPCKRDLLRSALDLVNEHRAAMMQKAIATTNVPHLSLRSYLREMGRIYGDHFEAMAPWYALRVLELPLDDRERREVRDQIESGIQLLSHGIAARAVFPDPYVAARSFIGALHYHIMLQQRIGLERATPELQTIFLDELVDLFAARPASPALVSN